MASTDAVLRAAVTGDGGERTLTLDPAFQGLPDTAHGGSVLALFDALASAGGDRHLAAQYLRRVPVGIPLALTLARDTAAQTFTLRDATAVLAAGHVRARDARGGTDGQGRTPALESRVFEGGKHGSQGPGVGPARPLHSGADAAGGGEPLPVSRTCFACGVDNALGLRARLRVDDARVLGTWAPRAEFERADGTLAPVALTTLLDEAAFWLGALASGESGMTTALAVTLHGAVAFGDAISVLGERADVRVRREDPRYWDTCVAAVDARGHLVAEATITFVAVRGAARRLVAGLLSMNPPQTLRRVFPGYVPA